MLVREDIFDQPICLLQISSFCYNFLLDLSGYMHQVTPTNNSPKSNPYFDTSVTTETTIKQIRVMISPTDNGNLFLEKCKSKTLKNYVLQIR